MTSEQPTRENEPKRLTPAAEWSLCLIAALLSFLSVLPAFSLLSPLFLSLAAAALGLLHAQTRHRYYFLFLPAVYLAALLVTRDPLLSLGAILAYPGGFALAICLMKRQTKPYAVGIVALLSFVTWLLVCTAQTIPFLEAGQSVFDKLGADADEWISLFREEIEKVAWMISTEYEGEMVISQNDVDKLVSLYSSILPAALLQIFLFLSYLSASLSSLFARLFGADTPTRPWRLEMSRISAAIYLLSFLLFAGCSLFSDNIGVLFGLSINLVLLLLPAFFLVGLRTLTTRVRDGEWTRTKTILLIFFLFIIFFSPLYLVYLCAIYGAVGTFVPGFAHGKADRP